MRRTTPTLLLAAMLAVTTAACGGEDKPKPTPSPTPTKSASASSNVADAPPWPTLTAKEKAAVKDAFADQDRADAVYRDLVANPKKAMANKGEGLKVLRDYYYSPQLNTSARVIRQLSENGGRMTGEEKTEWRVPTRVDLTSKKRVIESQECSTLGSFRVFNNGKEVKQTTRPLLFKISLNPAYDGTRVSGWRVSKIEEIGTCEN